MQELSVPGEASRESQLVVKIKELMKEVGEQKQLIGVLDNRLSPLMNSSPKVEGKLEGEERQVEPVVYRLLSDCQEMLRINNMNLQKLIDEVQL